MEGLCLVSIAGGTCLNEVPHCHLIILDAEISTEVLQGILDALLASMMWIEDNAHQV